MSTITPAALAAINTQWNHNRLHGLIPQSYLEEIGRAIYSNVSRGLWAVTVTCKVKDREALEYLIRYLTTILGYRVYWHREGEKVDSLHLVWKKDDYLIHDSWEVPDFSDPPSPTSLIPAEEETRDPEHQAILKAFLERDDWAMGMSRKTTNVIREAIRSYLSTSALPS